MEKPGAGSRVENALRSLVREYPGIGQRIMLLSGEEEHLRALGAAQSDEFTFLINELQRAGFIELTMKPWFGAGTSGYEAVEITITLKGLERADQLGMPSRPIDSLQVAVFMHFDPTLDDFFEEGLRPAIVDAGLSVFKINERVFPTDIDDEVMSGLGKCFLVCADLTNHRPNVYWEVGYADRSRIPVYFSCQQAQMEKAGLYVRQRHIEPWNFDRLADFRVRMAKRLIAARTIR